MEIELSDDELKMCIFALVCHIGDYETEQAKFFDEKTLLIRLEKLQYEKTRNQ